MGGFRPGAGSALANATGASDGAARGASPVAGTAAHTVMATLWQSWQWVQLEGQSGLAAEALTGAAAAIVSSIAAMSCIA